MTPSEVVSGRGGIPSGHGGISDAHERSVDSVLGELGSDPEVGLSEAEAGRRRAAAGPNSLTSRRSVSRRQILVAQLRSAVVLLLVAASGVGLLMGEVVEAGAIAVVLLVDTVVGYVTELRATQAMESLRNLASPIADVIRDGLRDEVEAVGVVPGDIVGLEAGDRVPADIRLVELSDLEVDESPLTGESEPVDKDVEALPAGTLLADRVNMAYMGTTVAAGRAVGVVVATGARTEVGRVAELADTASTQQAPLQAGLEHLGRRLSVVVVGLAGALALLGMARGLTAHEVGDVAIALAVAIVPEGLPAV